MRCRTDRKNKDRPAILDDPQELERAAPRCPETPAPSVSSVSGCFGTDPAKLRIGRPMPMSRATAPLTATGDAANAPFGALAHGNAEAGSSRRRRCTSMPRATRVSKASGSGRFERGAPRPRDRRRLGREAEMVENRHDGGLVGDVGENATPAAARAREHVVEVDASEQTGPIQSQPMNNGNVCPR